MARKLHPHEERAFLQASLPPLITTSASVSMRQQPGVGQFPPFDESSPDLAPDAPNWNESSWPDDWTW
jgi:hypothetical protein